MKPRQSTADLHTKLQSHSPNNKSSEEVNEEIENLFAKLKEEVQKQDEVLLNIQHQQLRVAKETGIFPATSSEKREFFLQGLSIFGLCFGKTSSRFTTNGKRWQVAGIATTVGAAIITTALACSL